MKNQIALISTDRHLKSLDTTTADNQPTSLREDKNIANTSLKVENQKNQQLSKPANSQNTPIQSQKNQTCKLILTLITFILTLSCTVTALVLLIIQKKDGLLSTPTTISIPSGTSTYLTAKYATGFYQWRLRIVAVALGMGAVLALVGFVVLVVKRRKELFVCGKGDQLSNEVKDKQTKYVKQALLDKSHQTKIVAQEKQNIKHLPQSINSTPSSPIQSQQQQLFPFSKSFLILFSIILLCLIVAIAHHLTFFFQWKSLGIFDIEELKLYIYLGLEAISLVFGFVTYVVVLRGMRVNEEGVNENYSEEKNKEEIKIQQKVDDKNDGKSKKDQQQNKKQKLNDKSNFYQKSQSNVVDSTKITQHKPDFNINTQKETEKIQQYQSDQKDQKQNKKQQQKETINQRLSNQIVRQAPVTNNKERIQQISTKQNTSIRPNPNLKTQHPPKEQTKVIEQKTKQVPADKTTKNQHKQTQLTKINLPIRNQLNQVNKQTSLNKQIANQVTNRSLQARQQPKTISKQQSKAKNLGLQQSPTLTNLNPLPNVSYDKNISQQNINSNNQNLPINKNISNQQQPNIIQQREKPSQTDRNLVVERQQISNKITSDSPYLNDSKKIEQYNLKTQKDQRVGQNQKVEVNQQKHYYPNQQTVQTQNSKQSLPVSIRNQSHKSQTNQPLVNSNPQLSRAYNPQNDQSLPIKDKQTLQAKFEEVNQTQVNNINTNISTGIDYQVAYQTSQNIQPFNSKPLSQQHIASVFSRSPILQPNIQQRSQKIQSPHPQTTNQTPKKKLSFCSGIYSIQQSSPFSFMVSNVVNSKDKSKITTHYQQNKVNHSPMTVDKPISSPYQNQANERQLEERYQTNNRTKMFQDQTQVRKSTIPNSPISVRFSPTNKKNTISQQHLPNDQKYFKSSHQSKPKLQTTNPQPQIHLNSNPPQSKRLVPLKEQVYDHYGLQLQSKQTQSQFSSQSGAEFYHNSIKKQIQKSGNKIWNDRNHSTAYSTDQEVLKRKKERFQENSLSSREEVSEKYPKKFKKNKIKEVKVKDLTQPTIKNQQTPSSVRQQQLKKLKQEQAKIQQIYLESQRRIQAKINILNAEIEQKQLDSKVIQQSMKFLTENNYNSVLDPVKEQNKRIREEQEQERVLETERRIKEKEERLKKEQQKYEENRRKQEEQKKKSLQKLIKTKKPKLMRKRQSFNSQMSQQHKQKTQAFPPSPSHSIHPQFFPFNQPLIKISKSPYTPSKQSSQQQQQNTPQMNYLTPQSLQFKYIQRLRQMGNIESPHLNAYMEKVLEKRRNSENNAIGEVGRVRSEERVKQNIYNAQEKKKMIGDSENNQRLDFVLLTPGKGRRNKIEIKM